MTDKRKIEADLPIRTAGLETERERRNFTDLPPQNYVHVWFARRPTPATRLAILSSVVSDDVDDDTLLRWMEIDPSNLASGDSISEHVREKDRTKDDRDGLVYEHYGYKKIWKRSPNQDRLSEIHSEVRDHWGGELPTVLDATAGGGAIPLESIRYGFPTVANELNPVASVILKSVLEHPRVDGDLSTDIRDWGSQIQRIASENLEEYFPNSNTRREPVNYLWAHTITCPDCGLQVPLAPNWWLEKDSSRKGSAVRPHTSSDSDKVEFEVVNLPGDVEKDEYNPTDGSTSRGKATCLRCDVVIDGDEVKSQAQGEEMGYQLYAVEYKDIQVDDRYNYRIPTEEDLEGVKKAKEKVNSDPEISSILTEERYVGPADRSANYGITQWRDVYSPRQLLVHYTYWQAFEEVKQEIYDQYSQQEAEAILTFLAIAADKTLDYNCRLSMWDNTVPKIAHVFSRHDFAFAWSFAEINLTVDELGYDWFLENVLKAYGDLRDLTSHSEAPVNVLQGDASDLSIDDQSIEAIVLDPPYYDNVMYAELSDFFYVWLKKYLGDVYPDFFTQSLSEKHSEAVANSAQFDGVASGSQSKNQLAKDDYESKMASIFDEMHRVLDDEGIFTLMFTHKKTEAWDTLTTALIEAGFTVNATHPVSTESPLSLHQAGKNSAESTILLASEKREQTEDSQEYTLWDEIKKETQRVAKEKARELDDREVEFTKVDMILASFGPTLEVFTKNYPVVNDEGDEIQPQQALDEARNAVSEYLIETYLNEGIRDVDSKTEWYVLSWLVFEAQRFPYDEARRLAIGLGEDLSSLKKTHRMWRKRSGDVLLRPHEDRVQDVNKEPDNRSGRKPIDPDALSFATALDKVHAALHIYDTKGATEAWNWMNDRNCDSDPAFKATLEALLRVLPHDYDDWKLARDLAAGETGDLLDLDLAAEIFRTDEVEDDEYQGNLNDF